MIVVGYSMGGPVGMLLARRHPGRVQALVMQATALEWRRTARERMVWRLLSVLELSLRLGTGAGFVERVLRQAIEEQPELDRLPAVARRRVPPRAGAANSPTRDAR